MVDRESAIIGDAREHRETIHADHTGIVKFSTREDPGYRKVLNAIEMIIEDPANQSTYKNLRILGGVFIYFSSRSDVGSC